MADCMGTTAQATAMAASTVLQLNEIVVIFKRPRIAIVDSIRILALPWRTASMLSVLNSAMKLAWAILYGIHRRRLGKAGIPGPATFRPLSARPQGRGLMEARKHCGDSDMARIGIIGSAGRMGQALQAAVVAAGHDLAGGIDRDGDAAALAQASDVLVDFSAPAALEFNLDAAIHAGKPIVVGTTGLEERHHWLIDAAVSIPVLQTGNTSLGVTLLAHLVQEAAARLGEDWDIEIVETHHRMKVDAPSGTALLLGEAAARGRQVGLKDVAVRGRDGITGQREAGTIGCRCAAAAWRAITPCISWPTTSA
jgi:4-hydroxy-tetrahydrodipicolinate reductase